MRIQTEGYLVMTVIFAGAFNDCVFVGADTRQHRVVSNLPENGEFRKIHRINQRVIAAKGGYAGTNDLWSKIEAIPDSESSGPEAIAAELRRLAKVEYEWWRDIANRNKIEDQGLYILVAGWELDGTASIHWINFKEDDFGFANGPGKWVAYGPTPDVNNEANILMHACMTRGVNSFHASLDRFAIDLVQKYTTNHSEKVGFPVNLALIDQTLQGKEARLERGFTPHHDFYRCAVSDISALQMPP